MPKLMWIVVSCDTGCGKIWSCTTWVAIINDWYVALFQHLLSFLLIFKADAWYEKETGNFNIGYGNYGCTLLYAVVVE